MATAHPRTCVVAGRGVGEPGATLAGAVAVAGRAVAVAVGGRDVPVAVGGTAAGAGGVFVLGGVAALVGRGVATARIVVPLGVGEAAWSASPCRSIAAINPPLAR